MTKNNAGIGTLGFGSRLGIGIRGVEVEMEMEIEMPVRRCAVWFAWLGFWFSVFGGAFISAGCLYFFYFLHVFFYCWARGHEAFEWNLKFCSTISRKKKKYQKFVYLGCESLRLRFDFGSYFCFFREMVEMEEKFWKPDSYDCFWKYICRKWKLKLKRKTKKRQKRDGNGYGWQKIKSLPETRAQSDLFWDCLPHRVHYTKKGISRYFISIINIDL